MLSVKGICDNRGIKPRTGAQRHGGRR